MSLSRRQLLLLASAARVAVADVEFWNAKPAAEWDRGDIYQLMNRSPWAKPVRGIVRPADTPRYAGPQGVVTWESSQAIRDALKSPLPDIFDDCYVIGVDGIPLGRATVANLKATAALRSYGRVRWTLRPVAVRELVRSSPVYAIGFLRESAPIGPDSGLIAFEAEFGRWLVESRFDPRKMVYRGRLAV
jgi:hypothetical protein